VTGPRREPVRLGWSFGAPPPRPVRPPRVSLAEEALRGALQVVALGLAGRRDPASRELLRGVVAALGDAAPAEAREALAEAPPRPVSTASPGGAIEDVAAGLDALGATEVARRLRTSPRPLTTLGNLRADLRERAAHLEQQATTEAPPTAATLRARAEDIHELERVLDRFARAAEVAARACREVDELRARRVGRAEEPVVRLEPCDPDAPLAATLVVPKGASLAVPDGGVCLAANLKPGQVALFPYSDAEGRRWSLPYALPPEPR
jgi:hypothetical protein